MAAIWIHLNSGTPPWLNHQGYVFIEEFHLSNVFLIALITVSRSHWYLCFILQIINYDFAPWLIIHSETFQIPVRSGSGQPTGFAKKVLDQKVSFSNVCSMQIQRENRLYSAESCDELPFTKGVMRDHPEDHDPYSPQSVMWMYGKHQHQEKSPIWCFALGVPIYVGISVQTTTTLHFGITAKLCWTN